MTMTMIVITMITQKTEKKCATLMTTTTVTLVQQMCKGFCVHTEAIYILQLQILLQNYPFMPSNGCMLTNDVTVEFMKLCCMCPGFHFDLPVFCCYSCVFCCVFPLRMHPGTFSSAFDWITAVFSNAILQPSAPVQLQSLYIHHTWPKQYFRSLRQVIISTKDYFVQPPFLNAAQSF